MAGLKTKRRPAKAPCATFFRLGAERLVFANTFSLLDSDLATCCWGKGTLMTPARRAWSAGRKQWRRLPRTACGTKPSGTSVRLRTVAMLPVWLLQLMEAEAAAAGGPSYARLAKSVAQALAALAGCKHDRRRGEDTCCDLGASRFPSCARKCG